MQVSVQCDKKREKGGERVPSQHVVGTKYRLSISKYGTRLQVRGTGGKRVFDAIVTLLGGAWRPSSPCIRLLFP